MWKISGWKLMGESATHDLVAGVLPANGMHFLACENDDTRKAIVADLAAAIASGNIANLVQDGKKSTDGWRLESGFLGLATGERKGVAIVGAATWNDVKAAAAWRGQDDLPIAVSTSHLSDIVSVRLHDLRHEINVGLVIVHADWSRGVGEIRRILNYRGDFAVLVVSADEPPANVIQADSRVLRVADGSLTLAHPKTAAPWARSFSLEAIKIEGGKAHGVRAGSEGASAPEFVMAAPEAPAPQEQPGYAGAIIYTVGALYGLHPSEAQRWPEGAIFVEKPQDVARAAKDIDGRVQVIVALAPDSKCDPNEERRRVQTACALASVGERVDVGLATRTLLDARDAKGRIAPAA